MLEEKFWRVVDLSKTSVDKHYEMVAGSKKSQIVRKDEELKAGSGKSVPSYLDKCKKIGKIGALHCKIDMKNSIGTFNVKGSFASIY